MEAVDPVGEFNGGKWNTLFMAENLSSDVGRMEPPQKILPRLHVPGTLGVWYS